MHPLAEATQDYETLLQFLYLAPVGLLQASLDGEIVMLNPISSQLLMPLAPDADLGNLFLALDDVAPDLRQRVADFTDAQGTICDGLRIPLPGSIGPRVLSLTLLKLDEQRMMAMISDATDAVWRERLLLQNETWLDAVLTGATGATDYAVIRLDGEGRIQEWNPGIGHVTGFDASVAGRSCAVFDPAGGSASGRLKDRLREADEQGWSLDDGWRSKADGASFWASAMISPSRSTPHDLACASTDVGEAGPPDPPAYNLVIRDLSARRAARDGERSTTCDALTGIADRRAFFAAIDSETTRSRRTGRALSLAFFEVDDFDAFVRREGRACADAVLRHVATLLASTFRAVDVPARVSDARFAVLLTSPVVAHTTVAERLRDVARARPFPEGSISTGCSISVGVVTVDASTNDAQASMTAGSAALAASRAASADRIELGVDTVPGRSAEHLS